MQPRMVCMSTIFVHIAPQMITIRISDETYRRLASVKARRSLSKTIDELILANVAAG